MQLNDKIDFMGKFMIKAYNKDGTVEIYEEKNLIMDTARTNMAQLIGGVDTGSSAIGQPINRFVIGTLGHVGSNILDYKQVGENGFDSTRTELFSEELSGNFNYRIDFDPNGVSDITVNSTGSMYDGDTLLRTDPTFNTVQRIVEDRTVTYKVTIPAENANSEDLQNPAIAYTEAALYASDEIFSMKCFPCRVKEETVKLEVIWSIIF
ncbi:hypothetical protein WCWAEYFT_CDS0169 [Vibrio phage VB_VaC_TDDLMA]